MGNTYKPFLVAEMVHAAIVPLRRSEGKPAPEWRELLQQDKNHEAAIVQGMVSQMKIGSTALPTTEEEALRMGIVGTMYREEIQGYPHSTPSSGTGPVSETVTSIPKDGSDPTVAEGEGTPAGDAPSSTGTVIK